MKIRFTRNAGYNGGAIWEGEIRDIPDADARMFLEMKKAEEYTEETQAKAVITGQTPNNIEWNPAKKNKVAMLSWRDYAGSGWHRAAAINYLDDFDVKLICNLPHPYGYQRNLTIKNDAENLKLAQKLIDECDIIHFKGDDLPQPDMWGLQIPVKKMCVTVGGSAFRRKEYYQCSIMQSSSYEMSPISEYLQIPVRTAVSCDLLYPEFDAVWTPNVIDTFRKPYTWERPTGTIIIGSSPSADRQDLKGTQDIFLPAIEILKAKGYNIESKIICGVDNKTCLKEKQKCHLFFDQGKVGFWGMSAVEAASYGIPVIVYVPDWVRGFSGGELDDCPFVFFRNPDADSCADAIESAITGNMPLLSLKTRNYAVCRLGYLSAAKQWGELYRKCLESEPVRLRQGIVNKKRKRVLLYQYRPAIRLWKWAKTLKKFGLSVDVAYSSRYSGRLIKGLDFSDFKYCPSSEYPIKKYDAVISFNSNYNEIKSDKTLLAVGDIKSTRGSILQEEREAFNSCKFAWFVSDEQRRQAVELFPRLENISEVVLNGVVEDLRPQEPRPKLGGDKLNVVWHGTLSADASNHRCMIEKFRHIASLCNLHVYPSELGCPDEYKNIGAIIHETVNPLELIGEISQYDAGLIAWSLQIPGTECSLPNKLFEYLVAGLPVISEQYPAIRQFAEGKNCVIWLQDWIFRAVDAIRAMPDPAVHAVDYESQAHKILKHLES